MSLFGPICCTLASRCKKCKIGDFVFFWVNPLILFILALFLFINTPPISGSSRVIILSCPVTITLSTVPLSRIVGRRSALKSNRSTTLTFNHQRSVSSFYGLDGDGNHRFEFRVSDNK